MSINEQLTAALELTLIGMTTVFLLLALMVLVIGWMSKLAHRLQPVPTHHPLTAPGSDDSSPDPALVSAISAAIHRYRRERS